MSSLTLSAPAKLNLTLDILGTRPDGYHEMEMVMQSVSLCDEIHLHLGFPGGIRAESGLRFLPNDKGNLAVAAAVAFRQATGQSWTDLRISIEKRIPVCAGTAGGSSDAAAVLRGLNLLTNAGLSLQDLARIGAAVGSDVPYCVLGGTALAQGRGETLTPLPALPACLFVLCKPRFSISTKKLYEAIDSVELHEKPDTAAMLRALEAKDLAAAARLLSNVMEEAAALERPLIGQLRQRLLELGALGARMTGSGSAVYGIFAQEGAAERARQAMAQQPVQAWLARPIG